MNRDRFIGVIMIGLVALIIFMYFSYSKKEENIEQENAELRNMIDQKRVENVDEEQYESEEKLQSDEVEIDNTNGIALINKEIKSYDKFIEDFINTLNISEDQNNKNKLLKEMSTEEAQVYLRENYYILDQEEIDDDTEGGEAHDAHTEGNYEPLEMDMELSNLNSYYTFDAGAINVLSIYSVNTTAGDENFSGNYILKGTITSEDGKFKFNKIDSIVGVNEPSSDEIFVSDTR